MEIRTIYRNTIIELAKIGLLSFWVVISESTAIAYFAIFPLLLLESIYRLGSQYEDWQDSKLTVETTNNCNCKMMNHTRKISSPTIPAAKIDTIPKKAA